MSELSSYAGKNAIRHLGNACTRWSNDRKKRKAARESGKRIGGDPVGFPKPRTIKRGGCRCQADNGDKKTVKTAGKRVKLPSVGWVRMRELPRFDGAIRNAFVSERGGRWFATLTYDVPDDTPEGSAAGETLGIDMGLKTLATLSDGVKIANPKPLKAALAKLRRLNKKLARQKIDSNRRARTKLALAKRHARIADIRQDHAHKTTTAIAKRAGGGNGESRDAEHTRDDEEPARKPRVR